MSTHEMSDSGTDDLEHLDFYVRRAEGDLVLVETMYRRVPGQTPENSEVVTFYFTLDEIPDDWVEAITRQGADLEEGKSCDFVTPEEEDYLRRTVSRRAN